MLHRRPAGPRAGAVTDTTSGVPQRARRAIAFVIGRATVNQGRLAATSWSSHCRDALYGDQQDQAQDQDQETAAAGQAAPAASSLGAQMRPRDLLPTGAGEDRQDSVKYKGEQRASPAQRLDGLIVIGGFAEFGQHPVG